jgi:hypothetical protein
MLRKWPSLVRATTSCHHPAVILERSEAAAERSRKPALSVVEGHPVFRYQSTGLQGIYTTNISRVRRHQRPLPCAGTGRSLGNSRIDIVFEGRFLEGFVSGHAFRRATRVARTALSAPLRTETPAGKILDLRTEGHEFTRATKTLKAVALQRLRLGCSEAQGVSTESPRLLRTRGFDRRPQLIDRPRHFFRGNNRRRGQQQVISADAIHAALHRVNE